MALASLGCPPKLLIQITQYLQRKDVLTGDVKLLLVRREPVRPLKNY
jgi:hypothetical protein